MENYNGNNATQSGDINLVSALMACAIPLKKDSPVNLISSETSERVYARFALEAASDDGKHTSQACVDHWTGAKRLDYAVDYLSKKGIALPGLRGISDIPSFVSALPSNPESYVLAFVANRKTCLDLFHNARRSVFMQTESGSALIDTRLSKPVRNEFLSRLQG